MIFYAALTMCVMVVRRVISSGSLMESAMKLRFSVSARLSLTKLIVTCKLIISQVRLKL
ncbi:hypothetical protein AEYBE204_06750 [Asticcacaulis sp. YBE204]|nr:hypothetical protein AEYBE204_06750 [Asticcacaulis sp. YBE204]